METSIFEEKQITRAALVSLITAGTDVEGAEASLEELELLLETAGGECAFTMTQNREKPDAGTYIGAGKLDELAELCKSNDVSLIVFDSELSPSQIRNIEDATGVATIDRSMLILDIFALHAKSREGKLQVELAQLRYVIPRLIGSGKDLSRLGGGIGTRGPGESKLESDRRHLRRRMASLEEALKEVEQNRLTQRKSRKKSGVFNIAVVGYTNAGKSTLLNYLTGAGILAEDKLFATLDTTTRKFELPSGASVLMTDTVGFIRNLPHHLIKAFRSTLEEAADCDGVLIVCDYNDSHAFDQLEVTKNLLSELGAGDKPTLLVYNKCDLAQSVPENSDDTVYISALTGYGVDALTERMERMANGGKRDAVYLFPQGEMSHLNYLYQNCVVKEVEYLPEGVRVLAAVDEKEAGRFEKWEK